MKKLTPFLLLVLSAFFMHNFVRAQGTQVYVQIDSITDGRFNVLMRDTATGYFMAITSNGSQANTDNIVMLDTIGNVIWSKDIPAQISTAMIIRASDGNYIVGGVRQLANYNIACAWKITPQGNSVWFRNISEGSAGTLNGIAPTNDGGCVLTGTSTTTKSFWIRLYGTGAIAVQRKIDITVGNTNQAVGCVHTPDDCFVGALHVNYGAQNSDTWIYKMDTSGTLVWIRSFDAPNFNEPRSMIQTSDGGFAILSNSSATSSNTAFTNCVIYRTDTAGHLLWSQTYSQTLTSGHFPSGIVETPDHGMMVFCNASPNYYMLRLDSVGAVLWCKAFGGNFQTTNTAYITPYDVLYIPGRFHYNAGNINKAGFLRMEDDSALICTMFASPRIITPFTAVEASPAITTSTPSFGSSVYTPIITNTVIMPVRTLICSDLTTEITEEESSGESTVYPNPATGAISIRLNSPASDSKLAVMDARGRTVDAEYTSSGNQIDINLAGWASGIYFYSVTDGNGKMLNGKFIVE